MKKVVLFITVIILSLTANAQESITDTWNYGKDKQVHELVGHSFGVSGVSLMLNSRLGYGYYESVAGVTVVSAFPILAKEGYDQSFKRGGFASQQDMVWGFGGVIESAFTTANAYKLSDWMLNKKIYGVNDSYTVPALFVGGGTAFLSELGKWALIDGYRFNVVNFGIKTITYGVSMLTKHHFDKSKGKHKYFEDKLKM